MNKNEIQDKLKQMEQEMADLRKKLDEPELYRGWMPAEDEDYYYADNTGYVGEAYSNDPIETKQILSRRMVFSDKSIRARKVSRRNRTTF